MAGRFRGAGGYRVLAVVALGAILTAMACGDDPSEPVVVGDGTTTVTPSPEAAELALPRCRDVPEVDPAPVPADPSSDPEVAAWQEQRAEVGLPSDEASTLAAAAAEAEAEAPVEDLGFPMTAEEADRFFGHQESNGELATLVQEAVGDEPWFAGVWLDNVHHVVGVGVARVADPDERQAELDTRFGAGSIRVVAVEHSEAELDAIRQSASAWLEGQDLRDYGLGTALLQNVVRVDLEVLDPARVADLAAAAAGNEGLCVAGAEPDEVVPEGPQPQAGEGWRLLADEPGAGRAYATGFAADDTAYAALWADIGLSGDPPPVDFATEVVAWFGPAVSGSCPEIRLDDVALDEATATLHAEIVLIGGARGCTSDANPHAYVVAVERAILPDRFTVSIGAPNTECCPEGTTEAELADP